MLFMAVFTFEPEKSRDVSKAGQKKGRSPPARSLASGALLQGAEFLE